MADFWQSPDVVTVHNLRQPIVRSAAERVFAQAVQSPVGTVVPAHYRDFSGPAMTTVIRELAQSGISANIVVVLNGATADEASLAMEALGEPYPQVRVLWAESEYVAELLCHLKHTYGVTAVGGKGLASWLGMGYLLHCTESSAIVFQDADVENYTADMTARLVLPLVLPESGLFIAKGYYARTGNRLYGRVTRQFLTPFVQALRALFPSSIFASLLGQLRYPLSGEIAITRAFASRCAIPCGWSLEMRMLWEVQRMALIDRLCQVEITDQYVHRHHPLASNDPGQQTLESMAVEIGTELLTLLAKEGNIVTPWHQAAFLERYRRASAWFHRAYRHDAAANEIPWEEEDEAASSLQFERCALAAMVQFRRDPVPDRALPCWQELAGTLPQCGRLLDAACVAPDPAECAA